MIKFKDVYKTYKNTGVEALKGVSFLIDDGEFVFIIGKSGSGKSTIMKCINCEEKPTAGAVTIDGFDISNMPRALVPTLRRQIGMIFQDFRLIESKTVYENIAFAGEIIGINRSELRQKVQVCLNIVGLKEKIDAYPQELSGGEQQRVAIARAMISNPKMIVADEPTGNLDPETSENIMGLLLDINRAGTTVIVCTHDANLVDRMKKRVIEIEGGLVVRDKEDAAYLEETADPYAEIPLGDIAFGDDGDYRSDFDEDTYTSHNEVADFYFGETPKNVAVAPAPTKASPAPSSEPLASVEPMPLPVEEIPAKTLEESNLVEEEIHESEALPDESKTEEPSQELIFGEEKKEVIEEQALEEQALEDDGDDEGDSWISKILMDDIDLDIQEDDE